MTSLRVRADHWLVTAPRALLSLQKSWLPAAASDSMFALRMRCGLVAGCDAVDMAVQFERIRAAGGGRVHVVIDGPAGVDHVEATRLARVHGIDVRWHDWRDGPLDIVDAMGSPDHDLLAAWRQTRHAPVAIELSTGVHADWIMDRYLRAVQGWETLTRAEHPDWMAEVYDPVPASSGRTAVVEAPETAQATPEAAAADGPVRDPEAAGLSAWADHAAQALLLRKDTLEKGVDQARRLPEFKQAMKAWGRSVLADTRPARIGEHESALRRICAEFDLLSAVSPPAPLFRSASRRASSHSSQHTALLELAARYARSG